MSEYLSAYSAVEAIVTLCSEKVALSFKNEYPELIIDRRVPEFRSEKEYTYENEIRYYFYQIVMLFVLEYGFNNSDGTKLFAASKMGDLGYAYEIGKDLWGGMIEERKNEALEVLLEYYNTVIINLLYEEKEYGNAPLESIYYLDKEYHVIGYKDLTPLEYYGIKKAVYEDEKNAISECAMSILENEKIVRLVREKSDGKLLELLEKSIE